MILRDDTQLLLGTVCWGFVMIWVPIIGAMGLTRILALFFGWRIGGNGRE